MPPCTMSWNWTSWVTGKRRCSLYTELQSAVHAMIQRLEYSFTFNPSLLTSPKRKKQVAEILTEAEKYIWRIKEEMRCA